MKTNRTNRQAFSLVEMLIVVGIIVAITGLALPAIMKARRAARQAICLENLHELGRMIHEYADQNNDYIPLGTSYGAIEGRDVPPTKRYRSDWSDMIWGGAALPPVGPMLLNGWLTQANAKLCYCPTDVRKQLNVDLFRQNFPAAKGAFPGGRVIQISYASRPEEIIWNCATGLDGDQIMARLTDFNGKALMAEPPTRGPFNHGSESAPAINVLYNDGSARMVFVKNDWPELAIKPWVEEITQPTKSKQRNDTNLAVWKILDRQ